MTDGLWHEANNATDHRWPTRVGMRGANVVIEYSGLFRDDVIYYEYASDAGPLHGSLLDDIPTATLNEDGWPTDRLRRLTAVAEDIASYQAPPPDVQWLDVATITWAASRTDGMKCFIVTGTSGTPPRPATQPADFADSLPLTKLPLPRSATLIVVPDQPPNELRRRQKHARALTPLTVVGDVVTSPAQAAMFVIGLPFVSAHGGHGP